MAGRFLSGNAGRACRENPTISRWGGEGTCPRRFLASVGQEEPDRKQEPTHMAQVHLDLDLETNHVDCSALGIPRAPGTPLGVLALFNVAFETTPRSGTSTHSASFRDQANSVSNPAAPFNVGKDGICQPFTQGRAIAFLDVVA